MLFQNMEFFYQQIKIFPGEQSWVFVLPGYCFAVYFELTICGMDNEPVVPDKAGLVNSYFRTDFRKSERQFVEDENGVIHNPKLDELTLNLKLCLRKIKLHQVT